MDSIGILIPLAPFLMVAAIVIIPRWMKAREREEMQRTLRAAIDKGQPLPPEIIEAMSSDTKPRNTATASSDLRQGVIWLAVGLAVGIFAYAVSFEEHDAIYPIMGMAAFPTLIGLAFIALSFFNKNKG